METTDLHTEIGSYTLNCLKCFKPYQSKEAFPLAQEQLCPTCKNPPKRTPQIYTGKCWKTFRLFIETGNPVRTKWGLLKEMDEIEQGTRLEAREKKVHEAS